VRSAGPAGSAGRGQEEAAAVAPLEVLDDDEELEEEAEVEEDVVGVDVDDVDSGFLAGESVVFPFVFSAVLPRESLR
jgi:hypothetical protein